MVARTVESGPAIVWFRDDLRLADNPALTAAAQSGRPLICLYVFDEASQGLRPLGGAARWFLNGALEALDDHLKERGGELILLHGGARERLSAFVAEAGASAVFWNDRYDAAGRAIDFSRRDRLDARRRGGRDIWREFALPTRCADDEDRRQLSDLFRVLAPSPGRGRTIAAFADPQAAFLRSDFRTRFVKAR